MVGSTLIYGAGRCLYTATSDRWEEEKRTSRRKQRRVYFPGRLPAPGIRSGADALKVLRGNIAVVVVGNSFYAIAGRDAEDAPGDNMKIHSFQQSSQVHPPIVVDLEDKSLDESWSSLFLASGRECAVVDVFYGPPSTPCFACSKPRHGIVTLPSPILSAAASWPFVAVLTSDGLVSVRSPSCLAVTLRTVSEYIPSQSNVSFSYQVEVGQRPNDFFSFRTLRNEGQQLPWIVTASQSGEAKVMQCKADTAQDLADRLMRHAIDAFGSNGFPRSELADAVGASFTAASYIGPEPTPHARELLQQYLEAVLSATDFESGANSAWLTQLGDGEPAQGAFGKNDRASKLELITSALPGSLMAGTALLCQVCAQLSQPNATLANRVAKICAEKIGVVLEGLSSIPPAALQVCDLIAEKLIRDVTSNFSLLSSSASPSPVSRMQRGSYATLHAEFIEASMWLFRCAGKHERALDVAHERLLQQTNQEASSSRGSWSKIKYESYAATHLSEIWCSDVATGFDLVLRADATRRLLENNPRLGLSVFTAGHAQNEDDWRAMKNIESHFAHPDYLYEVLKLLKEINPVVVGDKDLGTIANDTTLPLHAGRALAVTFLESAIGISTGRPIDEERVTKVNDHVANFHDELAFLLLEGVIAERYDGTDHDQDTPLGLIYRRKLRAFLKWPLAEIRSTRFEETLPSTFLQEKALILGRVGRHLDALRILYHDMNDLDLALEYCDGQYELQQLREEARRKKGLQDDEEENAYLPLVRVALDSDKKEQGIASAIKLLALRRGSIDRAAAIRMLPAGVPVSAIARPFLIPALIDSDSQRRRLTMTSALLRAKYLRLKDELTIARLRAQADLHVVPQFKALDLGELLHTSKGIRARSNSSEASLMPDLLIIKHFFPTYLIIQAKVTNSSQKAILNIRFVVAESSDEAIHPSLQLPITTLPPGMTGSAWCALEAHASRMDGNAAQLTCELRYTHQSMDGGAGRSYVEELQDLEVHAGHFS